MFIRYKLFRTCSFGPGLTFSNGYGVAAFVVFNNQQSSSKLQNENINISGANLKPSKACIEMKRAVE